MATQAPASLLNAGGKLSHRAVKRALCQVFRKAVDDHCAEVKKGNSPGPFNDRFFRTMQGYSQGRFGWLANNIVREMPVLAQNVSGGLAGTAMQVAASGTGAIQGIASGLAAAASLVGGGLMTASGLPVPTGLLAGPAGATGTTAVGLVTGAATAAVPSSIANIAHPGTAAMTAAGYRLGYPDGMMNFNGRNRCIEIKGPRDQFRPGQKGTFNAASRPKKMMEISCTECKANCQNGNSAPNMGCT